MNARRSATLLALLPIALWPAPAVAQQIAVLIGEEPTVSVAPDGEITVGVLVDMSDAGGLELADLELELSWDASRLSFVSTADGDFGTLSVDDADAANGTLGASLTSGGTTQSFTLLSLTLAAGSTEELVEVAGTVAAATDGTGSDVSGSVTTRTLDVCIGIAGLFGDVTGDGSVNIVDAQQIARFAIGLSVADPDLAQALGDVTEDGSVNIVDAQQTARFVVGLSTASRAGVQSAGGCSFGPAIGSVSALVEGESATISGSGFSDVPGENTVLVDGTQATVNSATETELTITVPAFDCLPARSVELQVTVGELSSDPVSQQLMPDEAPVQLGVGEQQILQDPATFCLQFSESEATEEYLIGVQSVSPAGGSLIPATVTSVSAGQGSGAGLEASPALSEGTVGQDRAAPSPLQVPAWLTERRVAESRIRAWELSNLDPRSPHALPRRLASDPGLVAPGSVPPDVSVGDEVTMRVPNVAGSNVCTDFGEVTATVRAIGNRGIWLEDLGNSAFIPDADLQALVAFLDDIVYDLDVSYFGEPSDIDGNGKIIILITKEINVADPNVGGFVVASDLFTRASCASSDEGEIYYGFAPDPAGSLGPVRTVADVLRTTRLLVPHEFAHVIQTSRRLLRGAPFMPSFMSEGQATFAEEVTGHAIDGHLTGQNLNGDVAWEASPTDGLFWYRLKFFDLALYFGFQSQTSRVAGAPEQCGWTTTSSAHEAPCGSANIGLRYDITWNLLRWISDHFGPDHVDGERGLHRAIIDSNLTGFDNLESVTGVPWEILLARWAAMLYTDDRIAGGDADLTMPSWDLFDIMVLRVVATARLQPRIRPFSDFTESYIVRAASSGYLLVSGLGRQATALRVRNSLDQTLPPAMQIWVVRTR